jgi:hypothetical protein
VEDGESLTCLANAFGDFAMNPFFSLLVFCWLIIVNASAQTNASTSSPGYGNNPKAGHYVQLNGVKLYYEAYGTGQPVVMIHGNGGNINYMAPQIEFFSKSI